MKRFLTALLWVLVAVYLGGPVVAQTVDPQAVVSVEVPWEVELPRGGQAEISVTLTIEPGWHINAPSSAGFLIPTSLKLTGPEYIEFGDPVFPKPQREELAWANEPLALYSDRVTIEVPVSVNGDAPEGATGTIRGTLRYQACSGEVCLPPVEKGFEIPFRVVAGTGEGAPLESLPGAAGEPGAENPVGKLIRERGLFLALLGVFLLGLGLNLTPCVYPMVPITVAYFGGIKGGNTLRTLWMALAYLLGLAVVYSGLGVAAAATGSLFGEALQRPWVWWLAAAVMVAMALSFFGLYHLRAPAFLTRRLPKGGRGGPVGAFVMGAFAGVVAAPCVGPATVALLSYVGVTQDVGLGFALFFALALGLGAPYVILALFSQRLGRLPRTGAWTVWVERLLGFVLLGLALYFVAPFIPDRAVPWIAAGLAAAAGIYLGFLQRSRGGLVFRAVRTAVGLLGLGAAAFLLVPHGGVPSGAPEIHWEEYTPAALQDTQNDKPVLLLFTADWCVYCHKLESTTFSDPGLAEFLTDTDIEPVKVDLTVLNPVTEALRRQYGVIGVPYLVLLSPEGEVLMRQAGYIGPDALERKIREALGASGG